LPCTWGDGLNYYHYFHITRYTRWFKYDRDLCGFFTHKSVPVIFEPPCITYMLYPCKCIQFAFPYLY
jgi:hypothetical protein